MNCIDLKFKDNDPVSTVEKIRNILTELGIEICEKWHDSGMDTCWSLSVIANKGIPAANGKGVTKELARASAYGELIERIQGGLFLYKFQSIVRVPDLNIQSQAPDGIYMTSDELIQTGDWMDYLIDSYSQLSLSREIIAEHCQAYSCDDRILMIPFYSLFENKHIYLPASFVDQMYTTNGCCAGNTREEAWVHALSEIMERYATIKILLSGKSAPKIPDEILEKYLTVSKMIAKIRDQEKYDIDVFDFSIGNGFPVVSTRIINKSNQAHLVNVAADPVLEIALQRTLTELFQGKSIYNLSTKNSGVILKDVTDFSALSNVINQLETGNGLFTADYFANELTCDREVAVFSDNSEKNNKQLLDYMINLYRDLGKQIYIRNYSYLGFPSYKIIVPGFSETRALNLGSIVSEYAIADEVSKIMRDVISASNDDLNWMLNYSGMIRGIISRYNHFGRLSGIPITGAVNFLLSCITRAYAAYRLGRYKEAIDYMSSYIKSCSDEEIKGYFECVNRYLQMKSDKIADEKIRVILYKFFKSRFADLLYANLDQGKSPYDEYLISCDYEHCDGCRYADSCSYNSIKEMNKRVGAVYNKYVNGQDPSEFAI